MVFVNIFVKEMKLLSFDKNILDLPDTGVSTIDVFIEAFMSCPSIIGPK